MKTSVLISGAGIAGASLAYWLGRIGVQTTIVEHAPEFRSGGYVIDFMDPGFAIAERMGLRARLQNVRPQIERVELVDASGHRKARFSGDLFRNATGGRFVSVLRSELARDIYDLADAGKRTIFGESVEALTQDGNGTTARLSNGSEIGCDIVVGADGVYSNVRRLTFPNASRVERFLGYFVSAFTVAGYSQGDLGIYVGHLSKGRQVWRWRLPDNRSIFFFIWAASDPRPAFASPERQKSILREAFAGTGWEAPRMLAHLDDALDFYFDTLTQIELDHWSEGRVVLLGDAASAPSLISGHGSGFAMLAAYVLAGELRNARGNFPEAFAAYQKRLMPYFTARQGAARRAASIFAPKSSLGLLLRTLMTRALAVPGLSIWLTRQGLASHFAIPGYPALR